MPFASHTTLSTPGSLPRESGTCWPQGCWQLDDRGQLTHCSSQGLWAEELLCTSTTPNFWRVVGRERKTRSSNCPRREEVSLRKFLESKFSVGKKRSEWWTGLTKEMGLWSGEFLLQKENQLARDSGQQCETKVCAFSRKVNKVKICLNSFHYRLNTCVSPKVLMLKP